ncbi:hypothetical protein AWB81_01047 [Caballeronia arationis]|jgi:hypothetical protein|uniref:Uncharacterized protein n=1 Tax=Caballeronia arationis TaxID=1777142 RepID=A0A7Z7I6B9_9BURK|nr:hypothetical protein [Caballeronia arationis]SAK52749.1 hypothetical protein AWB81_01047 [Caballeronia arationis]SOE65435.1 hypothetical protein SAMN05446927_2902 [Caballeronia arationis]
MNRRPILVALAAAAFAAAPSFAQRAEWLDPHVTQATIVETICVPGYADRVSPSFDVQMRQKQRLLKQRGIDEAFASEYALDHRIPVLLGGLASAPANLDLRPWEGRSGQRRKERLAVFLKRCVCTGDITLAVAQAAIAGDWANRYPNLSSLTCTGS